MRNPTLAQSLQIAHFTTSRQFHDAGWPNSTDARERALIVLADELEGLLRQLKQMGYRNRTFGLQATNGTPDESSIAPGQG
jgi:hypothetical protein